MYSVPFECPFDSILFRCFPTCHVLYSSQPSLLWTCELTLSQRPLTSYLSQPRRSRAHDRACLALRHQKAMTTQPNCGARCARVRQEQAPPHVVIYYVIIITLFACLSHDSDALICRAAAAASTGRRGDQAQPGPMLLFIWPLALVACFLTRDSNAVESKPKEQV